jgi:MFS family permease
LLIGTLLGGALVCVPLALSATTTQLIVWRVLLGLLAGGSMTLAYTLGGLALPASLRGSGFGLLSSAALIGGAVSPLLFGALAGVNLRYVFGFDAIIYVVVFVWAVFALKSKQ